MTSRIADPDAAEGAPVNTVGDETEATLDSVEETPAVAEEDEAEVSQGIVFDILRNERRRHVLEYLDEQEGGATIGELAERLAAIENDKPEAQITSQERKRLYVGLYQCHLPRMDDAGAIEFDSNRGTIERTEHTPSFVAHLPRDDADAAPGRSWPLYYLGVAGGATLALSADLAGLLPAVLSTQVLLALVVVAVGSCAVAHALSPDGAPLTDD